MSNKHKPKLRVLRYGNDRLKPATGLTGIKIKTFKGISKQPVNGHGPKHTYMESMLSEHNLLKRYPHMIKGSLGYDKQVMRQIAQICCQNCSVSRQVFTSDLFQVKLCAGCVAEERQVRRRLARSERRAMVRN